MESEVGSKIEKPSPKKESWSMEPLKRDLMTARVSEEWAGCLDVGPACFRPGKENDTAWRMMGYDSRRKHR